ncbi:hypothetical protein AQI84_34020 [Streptomyces griseorubiginosus]|uniref:Uncharacterized protein n=1 Tax=Streptomyces griseorubiginosus TaxID=67304 RepID=A0AAI8L3J8_9ACTN|nr:hypothetical protein DWG14_04809 [Streptomyces griseorubiginosus]KUM69733.1 hypothetical protein AQI84_34020 [Streptomyces griseorubiginosus]
MRRIVATVAATGFLLALGTGVSSATVQTDSANHPDVVSPKTSYSFACTLPQGNYANYSFSDGLTSTTIYYNNHCNSGIYVRVHTGSGSQCWLTPAGKGSSVFVAGVISITEGC